MTPEAGWPKKTPDPVEWPNAIDDRIAAAVVSNGHRANPSAVQQHPFPVGLYGRSHAAMRNERKRVGSLFRTGIARTPEAGWPKKTPDPVGPVEWLLAQSELPVSGVNF